MIVLGILYVLFDYFSKLVDSVLLLGTVGVPGGESDEVMSKSWSQVALRCPTTHFWRIDS